MNTAEMAHEAGVDACTCGCLERFAELVRADERARMAEQPAQQEPVATIDSLEQEIYENTREFVSLNVMEWLLNRLNTSPPAQRTWVGLSDQEMNAALDYWSEDERSAYGGAHAADGEYVSMIETWRYIEAKLKEKNT